MATDQANGAQLSCQLIPEQRAVNFWGLTPLELPDSTNRSMIAIRE